MEFNAVPHTGRPYYMIKIFRSRYCSSIFHQYDLQYLDSRGGIRMPRLSLREACLLGGIYLYGTALAHMFKVRSIRMVRTFLHNISVNKI